MMVMQRLGPSLKAAIPSPRGPWQRLPLQVVMEAGVAMLRTLKAVHEHGYVHRDVKPSNILLAEGMAFSSTLWRDVLRPAWGPSEYVLIDFGLASSYVDRATGDWLPLETGRKGLQGTILYASVNAHNGLSLGPRDDIESLAFALWHLALGDLPWSAPRIRMADGGRLTTKEAVVAVGEAKAHVDAESVCADIPGCFALLLTHARSLSHDELPDCDLLIRAFESEVADASCLDDDTCSDTNAYVQDQEVVRIDMGQSALLHAVPSHAAAVVSGGVDAHGPARESHPPHAQQLPAPLDLSPPWPAAEDAERSHNAGSGSEVRAAGWLASIGIRGWNHRHGVASTTHPPSHPASHNASQTSAMAASHPASPTSATRPTIGMRIRARLSSWRGSA